MSALLITAVQIKLLHTLLHALAIDDDVYRGILAIRYQVESSKQLSRAQAEELIGYLKEKAVTAGVWQERPGRKKKFHEWENRRSGMASPAQLRKIEAMWADVSRIEVISRKDRQSVRCSLSRSGRRGENH
jgi:hypothetical protein